MSLSRQGKGLQPQAMPRLGAPEIQAAGKGLQVLLGVRAGATVSCQGQQRAWRVPAELGAAPCPGGTGGEALSLPGTIIKACGDARCRHPSLHTQITSYMCFIYCAVFN